MKDIGEIKRSVTLTNDQWRKVVMCIAQLQLQYDESREYWEKMCFDVNFNGRIAQERAERMAKSYEDDIEKLEEIRMTIGGDVAADEQA